MLKLAGIKKRWSVLKEKIKRLLKRIILPGFQGQNLYKVGKFFRDSLVEGDLGARAATVTFRFLLALFPLIVCIFSLIPFVPIDNFQESIINHIHSFFPKEVYDFFDEALLDLITRKRGLLMSIGFLTSIYFASSGINALLQSFSASRHLVRKRRLINSSIWSVSILFIFFILAILITVVSSLGQLGINYLVDQNIIGDGIIYWIMTIFKQLILLLLYYSVISILFNVGNTEREKWKFFSVGASAATLFILILQKFFSIYLNDIAHFDKLYGPLGAALGFLLFLYYLFYVILIAFELNISIDKAKKTKN